MPQVGHLPHTEGVEGGIGTFRPNRFPVLTGDAAPSFLTAGTCEATAAPEE